MERYIAFLRGINVSGQKLIKMDDLSKMFSSFGFKNVSTFIQSGNVIFETAGKDAEKINKKIEAGLYKFLKYKVTVMLRTFEEIENIIKQNPFKKIDTSNDKLYVTFLSKEPGVKPNLPLKSEKSGVEIIDIKNRNAFCLSLPLKSGNWGFPNVFIEKEFKIPATTRNWNTVNRIVK